jgi:hypothetical protein
MANYSIPNSTPAIGRTSTPLSRQSRKQNNSAARCGPVSLRAVAESAASRPFNPQRSIQRVGRWMLDRLFARAFGVERWSFSFIWRVKGAWWSSRSSKPLSVPRTRDRGRFDSYPLRLNFSRHPERSVAESKDPVAVSQGNSAGLLDFARNDEHHKGGD